VVYRLQGGSLSQDAPATSAPNPPARPVPNPVHIEVEQARPAGERILLILNQRNQGEAGGVETSNRWAQLISFRDGLIIRVENYYNVDEALEAIGPR
jgi:ketosteroid isomerase-like protein